ncbi:MAG: tripartite tricarboxylate transporter permease [Firmicutes bacterium]|nr:tripartite tricarboxylate transporter permease [Bacillota bacterium]
MLENILTGVTHVFSIELLILIIIGTMGGIIIGALPGFSPTMGVALLVPFTFNMSSVEGLATLAAVYSGAVYGGSISAILLNIPGAPANIATIFDGYPMAVKGEGNKALLTSVISSFHGGTISAVALILIAPVLAIFALKFGPPEKFWVAIFGLVLIASMGTSKELLKGLISGAFGIWLGIIGISPITGESRFTFGNIDLQGGISLVPALVGLFAFSQALIYLEKLIRQNKTNLVQVTNEKGLFFKVYKEIVTKFAGLTVFSGSLGSFIGAIPGAGGQVGGIIAYDQAKRFSRDKKQFGKGAMAGVIAPEAANNGTVGGAIVPMLTLGIPGSPTAAVLLGGLLIHGLWPGPDLFTTNAETTYTFMFAFLLAQFALLVCGVLGAGYFTHVLRVPEYFLGPGVIALCIFGAFAVSNNYFDIYVMLILGIIGYFALKIGIPPAPAVLGLILGPIAESNLMLGMRIGSAQGDILQYFFTRPIAAVLVLLVVGAIVSTLLLELKRHNQEKMIAKQSTNLYKGITSMDAIVGLTVFVTCILTYFMYINKLQMETGIYASYVFLFVALLGLVLFFVGWRFTSDKIQWVPWLRVGEVTLVTLASIILGQYLGFYTSTFLLMSYLSARMISISGAAIKPNITKIIGFSAGITLFMYIAFGMFLSLPTPRGLFI